MWSAYGLSLGWGLRLWAVFGVCFLGFCICGLWLWGLFQNVAMAGAPDAELLFLTQGFEIECGNRWLCFIVTATTAQKVVLAVGRGGMPEVFLGSDVTS